MERSKNLFGPDRENYYLTTMTKNEDNKLKDNNKHLNDYDYENQ